MNITEIWIQIMTSNPSARITENLNDNKRYKLFNWPMYESNNIYLPTSFKYFKPLLCLMAYF